MTMTIEQENSSRAGIMLLFVTVILVLIIGAAISYGAIPSTQHALEKHTGDKWNPETISRYFDTGKCKPEIFDCGEKSIHKCDLPEGGTIALIIGKLSQMKVTGFKATTEYWNDQTDGCDFTGYAH